MFSIENDTVYSIEYIDRSNWLVKKIPVMDKETFIKCFKEWITPGEQPTKKGAWVHLGYDIYKCSYCDEQIKKLDVTSHKYCYHCGSKNEEVYYE